MNKTSSVYLPAKAVCDRYQITDRTLDRWLADPAMEFPRPMRVNNRRYFADAALVRWERKRITAIAAA
jgi:predicted DNA-binding transcriptional regulator AlpA